jgi:hypothetical protein
VTGRQQLRRRINTSRWKRRRTKRAEVGRVGELQGPQQATEARAAADSELADGGGRAI